MNLENFISNCRNPTIITRRGKTVSVACGRCADCQYRRSQYYTDLCLCEAENRKYVFFCTLTYKESCVPRLLLQEVSRPVPDYPDADPLRFIKCRDFTQRPLKKRPRRKQRYKKLPEYGQTLHLIPDVDYSDSLFQQFFQKTLVKPKGASPRYNSFYERNKTIRYLRKKDAQNFIKRLRGHISEAFNYKDVPSITYFITGEYGPQTFRPHFHVILYFDSDDLVKVLKRCVRKSWKLGRVYDLSSARDRNYCAEYCASYCNSLVTLPCYLDGKLIAPFCLHSKRFGAHVYNDLRDYTYRNVASAASEFDFTASSGKIIHYTPTAYNTRRLFPRCYNFSNQHPTSLYRLYTSFATFHNLYCETSIAKLTESVISDRIPGTDIIPFENRLFLNALDIFTTDEFKDQDKDGIKLYIYQDFACKQYYSEKLYNRVYSALYLSRCFLSFNCANHSPREVIDKIVEYHTIADYIRLVRQYEAMIEYNALTNSENYDIFYHVQPYTDYLNDIYNESSYIANINQFKDFDYLSRVKHKELNDANLIFVQLSKNQSNGKKSTLSRDGFKSQAQAKRL